MLRVSQEEEPIRTVITVDGRLCGDCVEFMEACCNQALLRGKPVELFLRDVSTVDAAARNLLCRLAAKGIHLLGRGVYTSYLLRRIKAAANAGDSQEL
jgi:hypothetical protein